LSHTTNKFNLPSVFERFSRKNQHTSGGAEITVTTLIDSPRIARLRGIHSDEIITDISDNAMAILGTAVHEILRQGASDDSAVEQRLFMSCKGLSISGQIDLIEPYDGGVKVIDYKTCTTAAINFNPEGKSEWHNQLNLYCQLCREAGMDVKGLEVVAILKDWTKSGQDRYKTYPIAPIITIPIEMWPEAKALEYIETCVDGHRNAWESLCTPQQRWERPEKYAVYVGRRARAMRVCDTLEEAKEVQASTDATSRIEVRPAVNTRCEGDYCSVSKHCKQFQEIKTNTGDNV